MYSVSVELPSGEIKKFVISPDTTLRQFVQFTGIDPEVAVVFAERLKGELGTKIGSVTDELFSKFNTNACVILDKNNVDPKDLVRFHAEY